MNFNEVFKSLTSILIDDCCKSHEELEKEDTQFKRRSYVKAFFTMIEGQVYLMKQLALALHKGGHLRLSRAELTLLSDIIYDLNGEGKAYIKTRYSSITNSLKFILNIYDRVSEANLPIDRQSNDWQKFMKAIMIRNRITHPKKPIDMIISDEDLHLISLASIWWIDIFLELEVPHWPD